MPTDNHHPDCSTYIHKYKHTYIYIYTHILILLYIGSTAREQSPRLLKIHIHTYTHNIHTYIHTYTHIHTYIHTHIHTYIHTYIHAQNQLRAQQSSPLLLSMAAYDDQDSRAISSQQLQHIMDRLDSIDVVLGNQRELTSRVRLV
jgi:hypothetical protein